MSVAATRRAGKRIWLRYGHPPKRNDVEVGRKVAVTKKVKRT